MPKASSTRTMGPSQRAVQGSNTARAARMENTPAMVSQHTARRRPSTLPPTGSFGSKAAARDTASVENHGYCLRMVEELEEENNALENRKRALEGENSRLREQLSEAQNSQAPTQTQEDIQALVQQIEGSLYSWKQRISGFNTSNPGAMLSIDPNWTQDHGALGSLNDPQLEPNDMLDVNAFY